MRKDILFMLSLLTSAAYMPLAAGTTSAASEIEQDMAALARLLAARMVPTSQLFWTRLPLPDTATHYRFQLKAGTCYKLLGIGHTGLGSVEMTLFDPGNSKLGSDSTDRKVRSVQVLHCAKSTGEYRATVKVTKQGDIVGMRVFSNQPKASGDGPGPKKPTPEGKSPYEEGL